jgi:hypothetical protein
MSDCGAEVRNPDSLRRTNMAEMTIRRVGVFSVAKIQALLAFVIGLLMGVIYGLFFMIFGAAISSMAPRGGDQAMGGLGSIAVGLLMMIGFPIFAGIMGFLGGAINGLIYNIAAGVVGGIKLDLEATSGYMPPPAPQQWDANAYQPGA